MGNVNITINFVNRAARRVFKTSQLLARSSQHQIHPAIGILCEGNVKLGNRLDRQRFMSGVADNANNFKRAVFRFLCMINDDVLAECVSSVEEFSHEGFVHHHDRHPFSVVA